MRAPRTIAAWAVAFCVANAIPAASATFDPDFFWLPPTVPTAATPTGPFDATALQALVVEVCQLNTADACVAGPPVERFTSSGTPEPSRITLDEAGEFYTVAWLTGPSRVDRDLFYRVSVFKDDVELGSVDVDLVQNTPELETVDATRYVGLVRGQQLTIRFRVQHPTARTRVTVNEVESSGGVPGDWIELYNTAAVPVSLADYVLKDNDDTHVFVLPVGATIPAQGHYVVEESGLGFGLGASDAVRFFTPDADGAVVVDAYSWPAHAVSSYGRCPNGAGAFRTTTRVTKGAANDCSVVIRINEVESSGGTPGDWVELYNPGPAPADLTGFRFKDNDDTHSSLLPGVVVPAGGFLVIDESDLGFGLGASDAARLFRPDGSLADTYTWTVHAATTYGRCPNGSGAFTTTFASTKGGANLCVAPVTTVHINEVESNGDTTDWIEFINTGASTVDLSGWLIRDNDDTHNYVLPAGTAIAAGGYLVVEDPALTFGLGGADSVRLYDAGGSLYASYVWAAHATTTYGRCPNGTGAFTTTTSSTKGASNACGAAAVVVHINEVESNGDTTDWVEFVNGGAGTADLSGWSIRDNDDTHTYVLPAGTTIPAGGYLVVEDPPLGFGLGSADSVRLYDAAGALYESYAWTSHASTTYGRCPNGTGAFAVTRNATKGARNACVGDPLSWPGDATVQTADGLNVFGGNLSGLVYEGSGSPTPGVLWAVRNGPESLFRLVWDGTKWTPDSTNGWGAGKALTYPSGSGTPDSEGVTFAGSGSAAGIYVSAERNNAANGVSRNSILRFDPTVAGTSLVATHEWNVTADLPGVGANLGAEAITWIPDTYLVSQSFAGPGGGLYNPADYPNHGAGLFFVGLEANGLIYAYALDHTSGAFTRIAAIVSTLAGVMDLHFDRETNDLWAACDNTCAGQSVVLRIAGGAFSGALKFDRPVGLPDLNNEGLAIAPLVECVADRRPVFWADDSETAGHAIRQGTLTCSPF